MKSHLPACFVWAFFTKNQVSHCPLFTVPQPFWMNTSKHQLKKWAARHPCNAGQTHQCFSFCFFACVKGHAYSPQNTNPSHLQGGRESRQPKGAIPWCHQGCPWHRGGEQQVTSCRRLPLTGGKDVTHTHPALPSRLPAHIAQITPKSSKALHTRGSLNKWFSEGKSLEAKQRLW